VPLQEDGIPLWVAGGGEKRNILDVFRRKSEILAAHCRDLGTDFDSITRSANYNVVVGASAAEAEDRLGRIADRYRRFAPADKVLSSMKAFRQSPTVGTTEQVGEALQTLQDAGMTYAICYFPEAGHDTGNIELFEREVMSALR
jgi:alkanesulfonate monooxygenase SsuD/methylene tetrahydromethanopterin reductase-like flavin-dependent oxidoreductase (luciferase family)